MSDERTPPKSDTVPTPAASESLGSWTDPTDVADRLAHEQARRNLEFERPPHY